MSNIIKSPYYTPARERRLIRIIETAKPPAAVPAGAGNRESPGEPSEPDIVVQARKTAEQIIRDAEQAAEQLIEQARAEADRLLEEARRTIDGWWHERRQQDERAKAEAAERGFEDGFRQGRAEAEARVQEEYAGLIEEARSVLESARRQKEAIISEAEPFLVELSVAVAGKLVHKQLTLEPDWVRDTVKQVLSRSRDKGTVTLCVSPDQYAFMCDARDDLKQALDSRADLLIVPDVTVRDHGCIVRSAYGSLDARIDTQLAEIKQALLQIAHTSGEPDAHA